MKGALSTLSADSARVLTLQGQLIQKVVLAEELQKAEDQQERCLRRLEAEVLAEAPWELSLEPLSQVQT